MQSIDEYLKIIVEQNASDLHLIAGDPARMRRYGDLIALESNDERLPAKEMRDAMYQIMPVRIREAFEVEDNGDFAYNLEGIARFRVNVFRNLGGVGAVFRAIPQVASTLEQLHMPSVIHSLCTQAAGMILVTGKTGSGKSTTLAAMVDDINKRRKGHIITIEDPIEFVHERKRCLISQREVGQHTNSFATALRSAVREDPDVILVGEMRDLETMGLAVTAAETGILVLGTLHTNGAIATMDRIINTFPVQKQPHIRTMLSTSLRGVISQQLLKNADNNGRIAAVEVLINTPATGNIIREGKTDQLENVMQGGALVGMQSMDNSIRQLLDAQQISGEEAYNKANNKADFKRYIEDLKATGA